MPESETLNITSDTVTWVTDHEGNKYLDFLSQLHCANAGHGNETINAAIRDQPDRIAYVSPSKRFVNT